MDQTHAHDIFRIEYPSSGHNGHPQNIVEGLYLRSRDPGPKKLVVVMPIWGTSTYPPDKVSHGYARHAGKDANVIWIYDAAPLFPWPTLRMAKTEEEFSGDGARQRRALSIRRRRHAPVDRLGGDAAGDRLHAHRLRRLQHERARDRDAARQRLTHRCRRCS